MKNIKRIFCWLMVICLLAGLMPVLERVEAEAVSGLNSLTCAGFISNATAQNYIDVMMRYYINNNSKLQTALNNGKSVIFMFEGGSDNYWDGSNYNNSASDIRDQAVCIVVQLNASGNVYIDFYHENCSSIPGDPSWCEYGVAYYGSTTILDGIYPVYTTNHTGPYAALQLNMSATNGYGYYTPQEDPDGYKAGASGINVHTRATNEAAGSDVGWAWSEGCQVIGTGSTSSNAFNSFMKSVTGITWDPWVSYYSVPKQLNSFASTGTDVGYYVVDRQLGLTNPSGTAYGSGSLINLYTKTALNNITSYSTSARSNADFSTDYRDRCTFYYSHVKLKTLNAASVNTLPCAAGTNGCEKIETAAKGVTLECTGLYMNHNGNYFYEIIAPTTGKTGYIYSTSVEYQGVYKSDLSVSGATVPNGHVAGTSFAVSGKVTAKYNILTQITVSVYSGFGTSGSKITGGSDQVTGNSYTLKGSSIDNATAFNELSAGKYTYVVTASYSSYFVKDEYTLMVANGKNDIFSEYFVVIPSAVSQSSCTHSYTTTTLSASTCTSGGSIVKSCSKCGLVKEEDVAATGHSFGPWTVVSSTCTAGGSRTRSCMRCGSEEKNTEPAMGHDYQLHVIDANCQTKEGYQYVCGRCGDYYVLDAEKMRTTWIEELPEGMDESLFEAKIQYRYAELERITSYDSSMDGYTLISSAWEQSGTGSVSYVNSWSSGISTSNSVYTKYNKKSSKVTAGETATTKTVVNSDAISGYVYHHWCYSGSYYSTQSSTGSYTTCHAFYSTTAPSSLSGYDSSDGSYCFPQSSTCSNSDWWWPSTVYTQKYTTYKKLFTYEGYGNWSAWSETPVQAKDGQIVESRIVYRLKDSGLGNHSWKDGVCQVCGDSCQHSYVNRYCTVCGSREPDQNFYLFGWIDGRNYACEEDYQNTGIYRFVDGKLVVTFSQFSYVAVKTGDNSKWYMTDGYPGDDATSAVLFTTDLTGGRSDKLPVPKGREITFTLVQNEDGTLTLSYVAAECDHQWSNGKCQICDQVCGHYSWNDATCENCGLVCGHEIWTDGVCQLCGSVCVHAYVDRVCVHCGLEKQSKDYYLFGFINGEDYGCETDHVRIGEYLFVDGVLTAYFTSDSYVAVKSHDNEDWYMTDKWLGWDATSGILSNTKTGGYEKMFVPGGKLITFRLENQGDDTFVLSFIAEPCPHVSHDVSGVCSVCGQTDTHSFEETVISATCNTDGSVCKSCSICGCVQTEKIPATGHNYEETVINPTCSVMGYTTHTCTKCGNSFTDSEVPAKGHSLSILDRQEPTCTEDGYVCYQCTICGRSFPEVINATGHSFVGGTCTACGKRDPNAQVTNPGLAVDYPSVSFESEILYNIYFTVENMTDVVEMGLVTFESRNANGTISDALHVYPGYSGSDGSYMAQTEGISAKNLGDAVYFKVYAKLSDGSYVYTDVAGYHAVAYAKSILKNSTNSYMRSLVVAMVNYGAEAQKYFHHNEDSLMNSFLTDAQKALVTEYKASMVNGVVAVDSTKAGSLQYNGSSYAKRVPTVSFDGAFAINYYFTTAVKPDSAVKLYYWTLEDYNAATTLSPKNATGSMTMTLTEDANRYWGQISGIAAKELDETVFVVGVYSYHGTTYSTGVLNYHIGKYCAGLAAKDTSDQQGLAKATAVYGYYAKEYFANL